MKIVGIDPGFGGAIAVLDGERWTLSVVDMPTLPAANGRTELDHHETLRILRRAAPGEVWIERVAARPGQGVSSVFRFGQGYGALEMACAALGLPIRYATPGSWKKHFGLGSEKDVARGEACRRFPASAELFRRKRDDGRAEAALIALYGRNKNAIPAT